jgi:hypothetical protein
MKTLYQHAFQTQALATVGRLSRSTILLLSTISCWPFSWRKLALTATRTQQNLLSNDRLSQEIIKIYQSSDPVYIIPPISGQHISFDDIIHHLSISVQSPVLASVVSLFVRAELLDPITVQEQSTAVILKEVNAALHTDRVQKLNYYGLSDPSWYNEVVIDDLL